MIKASQVQHLKFTKVSVQGHNQHNFSSFPALSWAIEKLCEATSWKSEAPFSSILTRPFPNDHDHITKHYLPAQSTRFAMMPCLDASVELLSSGIATVCHWEERVDSIHVDPLPYTVQTCSRLSSSRDVDDADVSKSCIRFYCSTPQTRDSPFFYKSLDTFHFVRHFPPPQAHLAHLLQTDKVGDKTAYQHVIKPGSVSLTLNA